MVRGFCPDSRRRLILLMAPRNLNEPVRCNVSALIRTRPPTWALSSGHSSNGVAMACPASRCAAASTATASGGVWSGASEAGEEGIDRLAGFRFVEHGNVCDLRDCDADHAGV